MVCSDNRFHATNDHLGKRGDWLMAEPEGRSVELSTEAADLDEATKANLKALGYAN